MIGEVVYLAMPYGHPDPDVRNDRMEVFYDIAARLIKMGVYVVSPLLHIETCKRHDIPDNWTYWQAYSEVLLTKCDMMVVITVDGWNTSTGVLGELAFCRQYSIPVTYVDSTGQMHIV